MVIDVHGHYIPLIDSPDFADLFELRPNANGGRDVYVCGKRLSVCEEGLVGLARQISDMDEAGIDLRLLSVPPFAFHYTDGRCVEWCRFVNDGTLRRIAEFGDRFRLLVTLPMASPAEACAELQRAMSFEACVGAEIASNIAGVELGDPSLFPFWETAEKLNAFVLVHPACVPESLRFQKYHLRNLIGNPLDTTIAAFNLISGGVLERFPSLRICLAHGGGYTALAVARFDHGCRVRPEFAGFTELPSVRAKKFHYDTVMHDAGTLDFVAERFGADRMLMGTDYPFDMGDPNPVGTVNGMRLSEEAKRRILGGSAENILKELRRF